MILMMMRMAGMMEGIWMLMFDVLLVQNFASFSK